MTSNEQQLAKETEPGSRFIEGAHIINGTLEKCNTIMEFGRPDEFKYQDKLVVKRRLREMLEELCEGIDELNLEMGRLKECPQMTIGTQEEYRSLRWELFESMDEELDSIELGEETYDNHDRLVTYLYSEEDDGEISEKADKMRQAFDAFESDELADVNRWIKAVKKAFLEFAFLANEMAKLSKRHYTDSQFESAAKKYEIAYRGFLDIQNKKDKEFYDKQVQKFGGKHDRGQLIIGAAVRNILDSDFIVYDEDVLPQFSNQHKELLSYYIGESEVTDDRLNKFYTLLCIVGHEDSRFQFEKKSLLGCYLWNNRVKLTRASEYFRFQDYEITFSFFHFCDICTYAYRDFGPEIDEAWRRRFGQTRKTAATGAKSGHTERKRVGRGAEFKDLFVDERTKAEKARQLKGYLSEHKLMGYALNTRKAGTLNQTTKCFVAVWKEEGMLADDFSGASVYRFLTADCGVVADVTETSYKNKFPKNVTCKDCDLLTLKCVRDYIRIHP